MKIRRRILTFLFTAIMLISSVFPVCAASASTVNQVVNDTAAYMLKTVKAPEVGSIGGEWAVIGLARSGYDVPQSYYSAYYANVEKYVRERSGILHDKKYTEYSRVILGLTAAGYDPTNVAGYDLTVALGDYEKTIWQGINGPIWALIALDCGDYEIPNNPAATVQATREMYIDEILRRQLPDGGWNLTAGSDGTISPNEVSDPDLTGMALQALSRYQDYPSVVRAINKAITYLSNKQDAAGGYSSWGTANVESASQVLVAITSLGISVDDERFVKNGNSLVDNILSFRNTDSSFKHTADGSGNSQMSTEQAFYALVAAKRADAGEYPIYNMTDITGSGNLPPIGDAALPVGLPDKHADVRVLPVTAAGRTFTDIKNHQNQTAIEALASRGIISGIGGDLFAPDATMTRAEFATIVVNALGLPAKSSSPFTDFAVNAWYGSAVSSAYYYQIVAGTSATTFNPNGTITRQEAAVMVSRAAVLCGMDVSRTEVEIRDTLAQFGDYRTVASWANGALAFCYDTGILDDAEFDIQPLTAIKRCEVAEMIYRMLAKANLI